MSPFHRPLCDSFARGPLGVRADRNCSWKEQLCTPVMEYLLGHTCRTWWKMCFGSAEGGIQRDSHPDGRVLSGRHTDPCVSRGPLEVLLNIHSSENRAILCGHGISGIAFQRINHLSGVNTLLWDLLNAKCCRLRLVVLSSGLSAQRFVG